MTNLTFASGIRDNRSGREATSLTAFFHLNYEPFTWAFVWYRSPRFSSCDSRRFSFSTKVFAKITQIKANLKKISESLTFFKKTAEVPVLIFLQNVYFRLKFRDNFLQRIDYLVSYTWKRISFLNLLVYLILKPVIGGHTCTVMYEYKMSTIFFLCVKKRCDVF